MFQEHKLYKQRQVIIKPILLPAATVDEMELTFHLIHGSSRQQYWFDDNLTLFVQFVLLIMSGGSA
jgi:hypothetical protein